MTDVIVVGSVNMDLVVRVPRLPAPGETLAGRELLLVPGGKGANQAVAVARMGQSVVLNGNVGDDGYGQTLLDGLRRNAVDVTAVAIKPACSSGLAFINVDDQGQNAIVILAGANGLLEPQDVTRHEALWTGARILITQFEIQMPTVEQAVRMAKQHGLTVILNPAPAAPMSAAQDVIAQTDYLILNETELEVLTGIRPTSHGDLELAGRRLLEAGARVVIVTLGADGAATVEPRSCEFVPAVRVDAVDTTAAGDAFIGAFAAALLRGEPLRACVAFANRAGALAVTRPGAQPSLPTYAEVEAFERPSPQSTVQESAHTHLRGGASR